VVKTFYHCTLNVKELQCRFCPSLVAVKDRKIIGFCQRQNRAAAFFPIDTASSITDPSTAGI